MLVPNKYSNDLFPPYSAHESELHQFLRFAALVCLLAKQKKKIETRERTVFILYRSIFTKYLLITKCSANFMVLLMVSEFQELLSKGEQYKYK